MLSFRPILKTDLIPVKNEPNVDCSGSTIIASSMSWSKRSLFPGFVFVTMRSSMSCMTKGRFAGSSWISSSSAMFSIIKSSFILVRPSFPRWFGALSENKGSSNSLSSSSLKKVVVCRLRFDLQCPNN